MRNLFFFIFLCITWIACGQKDEKSSGVLSVKKMEDVIWDLNRADMLINLKAASDSTINKKNESIRLYEQIFSLHKTSQSEVKKSLAYYQAQPALMKIILDSLSNRQQRAMQELYSKPDTANRKQSVDTDAAPGDSIQKIRDQYKKYQGGQKPPPPPVPQ